MDDVDTGIKMLVEAITEAQYAADSGMTSTPVRNGTSRNQATSTTNKSFPLASGSSVPHDTSEVNNNDDTVTSANSSLNSGYTADTSNIQPYIMPSTPPSPTANLKMLVAAASSALDRENAESSQNQMLDKDDEGSSRKMKSLALLCKKFLQVADREIGPGKEFSLEMIATSLGINRRRIYDIINVMEALEMISKQSKNWYLWHGQSNLVTTLAKLKAMAVDDPDIQPYLDANFSEENNKENESCNKNNNSNQVTTTDTPPATAKSQIVRDALEEEDEEDETDMPAAARSVRYDKSLGVLCQKFVMLFLISACTEITLEDAGKILVPDYHNDTLYMALNPSVNPKTKVRRLYDIANILSSLGLIKKKVFVGPHHIKKPGYAWSGPSLADIEAISVARKNEYTLNRGLMRRSISSRPYLHQYEVQQQQQQQQNDTSLSSGSAPNSPTTAKTPTSSKFKRSLSFGGAPTTTSTTTSGGSNNESAGPKQSPTVVARPLCPKQVDYLREMKEFENEMQKHSHRYPHVASIFHEFLQKYQTTMEQTASANGRFILPKAATNNTLTPPTTTSIPTSTSNSSIIDNNNESVQPTMAELSNSPPDTMSVPLLEHTDCTNNISTNNNMATQMTAPATTTTATANNNNSMPPSCRFETQQQVTGVPKAMTGPGTPGLPVDVVPRESCAVREKQKALERLVLKPPNTTGQPYSSSYQPSPLLNMTPPSVINIPTSTLVTNLANSILVNVLQNNMLEAANNATANNTTTSTVTPSLTRGTLNSSQPVKPAFVNVDDLLIKSGVMGGGGGTKENYFPTSLPRQQSPYSQQQQERSLRGIGPLITQLHTNRSSSPLVTEGNTSNGGGLIHSFNPNHFLTSQATPYSQCGRVNNNIIPPQPTGRASYPNEQPHSPNKRPRLE